MAEEAKRVVRVRLSDEQMAELWKRVGGRSCERHAHEIERLRAALHAIAHWTALVDEPPLPDAVTKIAREALEGPRHG